jgi:hypothetical protein
MANKPGGGNVLRTSLGERSHPALDLSNRPDLPTEPEGVEDYAVRRCPYCFSGALRFTETDAVCWVCRRFCRPEDTLTTREAIAAATEALRRVEWRRYSPHKEAD